MKKEWPKGPKGPLNQQLLTEAAQAGWPKEDLEALGNMELWIAGQPAGQLGQPEWNINGNS